MEHKRIYHGYRKNAGQKWEKRFLFLMLLCFYIVKTEVYAQKVPDTYNLLLIGVDRRDDVSYGNSDVMMLVTVNESKETIFLTSFLRDLYADIPEYGVQKLNAACAIGGPELCVETICSNYQVEIDHYAMVDFNAMIKIVESLGGVEMEITEDEMNVSNDYIRVMCEANEEPFSEHELTEYGLVWLDGYQTVGFARNRYSGNTYDFGRTERQRKVMTAIFETIRQKEKTELASVAMELFSDITHNIGKFQLLKLAARIPEWMQYEIEELHIPYDGEYHSENEILIPDDMQDTIERLRETLYAEK